MESIMGKNEFLSELEKSLSVLQEDELRDIISEYEQHIDIKVEKGLTEEEVIADFGSLAELTGEILEAYHVRVDYAAGKGRNKAAKTAGQEGSESFEKLKRMGEKGSLTLWSTVKGIGAWMAGIVRWIWHQARRPFVWLRSRMVFQRWEYEECGTEEGSVETGDDLEAVGTGLEAGTAAQADASRSRRIREDDGMGKDTQRRRRSGNMTENVMIKSCGGFVGTGVHSLCRGIRQMIQWMVDIALWGIRLAWNGCWIMFSVFAGGFGLFSLFGLGLLTVLLTQGYPLVGVTIGCGGLVCCMFSAAGLGMTFLWRPGKSEVIAPKRSLEKDMGEERGESPQEYVRRRIHKPGRSLKAGRKEAFVGTEEFETLQGKGDGQDA